MGEVWPIGQLAEIDVKSPGEPPETHVVRWGAPNEKIRQPHWESLDGEWSFQDGDAITAVRPFPLMRDREDQRCSICHRKVYWFFAPGPEGGFWVHVPADHTAVVVDDKEASDD